MNNDIGTIVAIFVWTFAALLLLAIHVDDDNNDF